MTINKPTGGPNMQKKLLLKDLAKCLAADSKLTEQASEEFIHLFFSTIQDGLNQDGQVKIKGWGTFKVIETSDRTSVDVSTGNRITIDGYKKITFTPEASLKELINKPFSGFETVPLNEDYDVTGDEIIEHQETTENADDDSTNEVSSVETGFDEPIVNQTVEDTVTDDVEETTSTPSTQTAADTQTGLTAEEPTSVETAEVADAVETNETAPEAVSTEETEEPTPAAENEKVEKNQKSTTNIKSCGLPKEAEELSDKDFVFYLPKESHGYYWYIWVPILLCALIGVGLYCIFQDDVTGSKLPFGRKGKKELVVMNPSLTPVEYVDSSYSDTTCVTATLDRAQTAEPKAVKPAQLTDTEKKLTPKESAAKADTLSVQSPAPVKEVIPSEPYTVQLTDALKQKTLKDITPADTTGYVMAGTMTSHTLLSGETLTSVSLYYYGDKRLWPYLVKYNNIKNHNSLAIGQQLKIPYLKKKE